MLHVQSVTKGIFESADSLVRLRNPAIEALRSIFSRNWHTLLETSRVGESTGRVSRCHTLRGIVQSCRAYKMAFLLSTLDLHHPVLKLRSTSEPPKIPACSVASPSTLMHSCRLPCFETPLVSRLRSIPELVPHVEIGKSHALHARDMNSRLPCIPS